MSSRLLFLIYPFTVLAKSYNYMHIQYVCSYHPCHTMISLLYKVVFHYKSPTHGWELLHSSIKQRGKYRIRTRTKILSHIRKGLISLHDKNIFSPSPVFSFFQWIGKVRQRSTIQFAFQTKVHLFKNQYAQYLRPVQ
jgi:hypothetical protein